MGSGASSRGASSGVSKYFSAPSSSFIVKRLSSKKINVSSKNDVTHIGRNENIIVSIMMPVYYTTDPLSSEEIGKAAASWQTIVDDTAPEFVRLKGSADFEYSTAMTFFFDTFYNRFFDIHPVCCIQKSSYLVSPTHNSHYLSPRLL
jgi:hypothetical protein